MDSGVGHRLLGGARARQTATASTTMIATNTTHVKSITVHNRTAQRLVGLPDADVVDTSHCDRTAPGRRLRRVSGFCDP
jgi:aspartate/glutamate racemase